MSDETPSPGQSQVEKPKRAHDWRTILIELAIVVVGVCLALAAQQTVDWLHWQGEVAEARGALRAEMSANNRYYARRIAIAPCMDKMIGEAQRIIDGLESNRKATHFTVFHLGQGTTLSESEWQSERSSQVLTHFPRTELALMSRHYAQIPRSMEWMAHEASAWAELSILQNPPVGLSPDGIARLRVNLALARQLEFRVLVNSLVQIGLSDQLGLPRATPEPGRVEGFCKVNNDDKYWSQVQKGLLDNLNAARRP